MRRAARHRDTAYSQNIASVIMKVRKTGRCRLCLKSAELSRSHIIPEFFHRPLYDAANKARLLRDGATKVRWIQVGERQRLLCRSCEGFVNREYEQPAMQTWREKVPNRITIARGFWNLSGLDVAKFKLFHLSVLWRASVANGAFSKFNLAEAEAETLRRMLLEGDAGRDDLYRLVGMMLVFPDTGSVCHGLIAAPFWADVKKHVISFAFGGCGWLCITKGPGDPTLERRRLLGSGEMSLRILSLYDYRPATNFMAANIRNWVSPLEGP
jgi:hypothetical protein